MALLGGVQGVGKTIAALQWARTRSVAAQSQVTAVYVCFEHDERYLFHRLLCLESADGGGQSGLTLRDIRQAVLSQQETADLQTLLHALPAARRAFDRLTRYWEHLHLVKGHPLRTTLDVLDLYLDRLIHKQGRERVALFVDYLQKVPLPYPLSQTLDDNGKVTLIVEGLKNLALAHQAPVVAVAAADKEGLQAQRLRLHHLRGESALAYECDVVIMMNIQAAYQENGDPDLVGFTIEKNRTGPTDVEVVYRRRGAQFRFEAV